MKGRQVKISVFGATGGTGREVVEQALERRHEVTALARRPEALEGAGTGLTVVGGDVLDRAATERAVDGANAVLCVLGAHKSGDTTVSDGTRIICAAMEAAGVGRLVAVTMMGLRDSRDKAGLHGKVILPVFLRGRIGDRVRQEEVIEGSGLDYCIVRPARLVDGPRTERYQAGPDLRTGLSSKLARGDLAHYVVTECETRPSTAAPWASQGPEAYSRDSILTAYLAELPSSKCSRSGAISARCSSERSHSEASTLSHSLVMIQRSGSSSDWQSWWSRWPGIPSSTRRWIAS